MNRKSYTKEEKQNLVERYLSGERAATIKAESDIPRSTFYAWIKQYRETYQPPPKTRDFNLSNFRALESKNTKLENMVKILQSASCTATAPLSEKL